MSKYKYYISSGELNRMYTLRVAWTEICKTIHGECFTVPRDYYCCNLSIDHDKAYTKAVEYVSTREGDLVEQSQVPTLEDIYRRNQEEMEAARLAALETAKAAAAAYEERCFLARLNKIEMIREGCWPFGKYRGLTIGHEFSKNYGDYGYIQFLGSVDLSDCDDQHHKIVMGALQSYINTHFEHLFNLPVPNGNYYGKLKSRDDFELTLVFETEFESNFGYNQFISLQKFVKVDTGEAIVYKGNSPIDCKLGKTVCVKATVHKHEEYKGDKQTFIARPKLIA